MPNAKSWFKYKTLLNAFDTFSFCNIVQALGEVVNVVLVDATRRHSPILDDINAVIFDQSLALLNTQAGVEEHSTLLDEVRPIADGSGFF